MEIESTNHQDVADPDQIVSGVAGTGHEYQNKNGITGKQEGNSSQRISKNSVEFFSSSGALRPSQTSKSSDEFLSSLRFPEIAQTAKRNRENIGLGVLYNGTTNAGRIADTTHCTGKGSAEDPQEGNGDLFFSLYERQERIADRLNKKIERLDRRLTTIEKRGRME